ncbi:MAG: cob(I)yrinic acid a,c-diamide adenosyltransferase [Tissierellia bacterium]|jgi:cob(I)alamin adenosyltransferase|nr:cob(I)yrinic acid a,c-diamide adenosyltransferase [Tissierellia bacterium]
MKEKRYIHVYTGDGKGKTTAAFGLAIRAACAGLNVYIGQFVKGMEYSEVGIQKVISNIKIEQYGRDCFIDKDPELEDFKCAEIGFDKIKKALKSDEYDVVILDEITVALYYKLVDLEELIEVLKNRNQSIEVILTGRNAPNELIEIADLVTEMREIKHYYQQGVLSREGIDC